MRTLLVATMIAVLVGCGPRPLPPAPRNRPFTQLTDEQTPDLIGACRAAGLLSVKGGLKALSDAQVVNDTCAIGAVSTELARRDRDVERASGCVAATAGLRLEFKRRYPEHTTEELLGRC